MANSRAYTLLKLSIQENGYSDYLYKECCEFVDGMMFFSMCSPTHYFKSFCMYAISLGIEYSNDPSIIAMVEAKDGDMHLLVNPINVISRFENEDNIYFVVAHEVEHLLLGHVQRYYYRMHEQVSQLFMNLATDWECNERLKNWISDYDCWAVNDMKAKGVVPEDHVSTDTIIELLSTGGVSVSGFSITKGGVTGVYEALDEACRNVFGYTIAEAQYFISLRKDTSFLGEVARISLGFGSSVFDLTGREDMAQNFCKELMKYLDYPMTVIMVTSDSASGCCSVPAGGSDEDDTDSPSSSGRNVAPGMGNGNSDDTQGENSQDGNGSKVKNSPGPVVSVYANMSPEDFSDIMEKVQKNYEFYSKNNDFQKGRSAFGSGKTKNEFVARKSVVPWQSVLAMRLRSLSDEKVYSKNRINRRQPDRLDLSGTRRKRSTKLIIAIDESGSIEKDEYNYFMSEIKSVVSQFSCEVHLVEFTSAVENHERFREGRFIHSDAFKRMKTTRHTGGTCFQPVFDLISENPKIHKRDCCLVMLTDGEGEEEVDYKGFNNRLWVIAGSSVRKEEKKKKTDLLSCKESAQNIYPVVLNRLEEESA